MRALMRDAMITRLAMGRGFMIITIIMSLTFSNRHRCCGPWLPSTPGCQSEAEARPHRVPIKRTVHCIHNTLVYARILRLVRCEYYDKKKPVAVLLAAGRSRTDTISKLTIKTFQILGDRKAMRRCRRRLTWLWSGTALVIEKLREAKGCRCRTCIRD